MKHIKQIAIIAFILFASPQDSKAQSVERFAVASSGGEGQGSSAQITWTCGESAVSTFQNTNNILSQGFQQLYINNTSGLASSANQIRSSVYPVPCINDLTVNTILPLNKECVYTLYNSLGVVIDGGKITQSSTHINTQGLAAGDYFLFIRNETGSLIGSHKINKSN